MIESLLRLAGLDWAVPDFSTLSRRQKHLQVRIPVQQNKGCLHLLVDSTGIKMMGEGKLEIYAAILNRFTALGRPQTTRKG